MITHTIEYDLAQLAKNAPLTGYIYSTQYPVKEIKRIYELDDKQLVSVLMNLKAAKAIREVNIRYSKYNSDHIDLYWFR